MSVTVMVALIAFMILLAARVPIAVGLFLVGVVGIILIEDFQTAIAILKAVPYDFATSWTLSALPMYLLMGCFAYEMGMAHKIYDFVRYTLRKVAGSLAVTTAFSCAAFGAISGSAAATTVTFGKLAIPEMLEDNYDEGLATGCIAASGTMGSLMPPSILMLIYAALAEVSVGRVFAAGILPCIISALIYGAMIAIRCKMNPQLASITPGLPSPTFKGVISRVPSLTDVFVLVAIVFGGIYSGLMTATEAGAVAAFAALLMGLVTQRLDIHKIKRSVIDSVTVTGQILIIGVGAHMFVRLVALAGIHNWLGLQLEGLSQLAFLGIIFLAFLILGMFIDPIGIILLLTPIVVPLLPNVDISRVWFCILLIKGIELGNVTPPMGMGVYIVKSVVGERISIGTIFRGISWFAAMDVLTFGLLAFFPAISLILPQLIFG